ncbi:catalase (plasmid) [Deinococcus aetherius]|uniref:Catalase n=1 Tax=Deinococcus aetherius TaxID=200252 RepID=A0ABM8AL77_9DEIO|nr:catalase [Deinococcus aetherius]BDP44581.1 catalase [Deinococcus aetherius]
MSQNRKLSTPLSLDDTLARLDDQTKDQDLSANVAGPGTRLTDNMGHPISDDQNSLRAGARGPTLMEDFLFREKIHHFDHERIPERVVHARGAGAHGYFELTKSLSQYTTARVLTEVGAQTPVFVRFSTVAGSRGSADTARDVRGFAVRFYTQEGNWDIVGNNIPVFFIQDAIKFPDLIHSVKPEPHHEIPQAASAHDTFYDFISLTPESMHMLMWVHSDRAIPRSFAMMEGFGVHTFRLVDARGQATFVKFHWKPTLGVHSLVWDEAQKIAGKDPDFHRRSMWESIEAGHPYVWDLGVQLFTEAQAEGWDFDVLDPTKIVPEDLVPVQRVGRLTLDRNPDNYFAETEQVGFMTTNLVPGIDFSDDPLLQGRNFSYLDTQLSRLGSPNWPELPINRPVARVANHQRDGHMRQTINRGRVSYEPNTLGGNKPAEVPAARGGFASFPERVSGPKVRARAQSFSDHYGQARLFWNSMTPVEKEHITRSLQFELSKVETRDIRLRMLAHLEKINEVLAAQVARALGERPTAPNTARPGGTADSAAETARLAAATSPTTASGKLQRAKGLSMEEGQPRLAKGRKVAILAAEGVDAAGVQALRQALKDAGAMADVVGPHLGTLAEGVVANKTLANTDPVLYDAVFLPGGASSLRTLIGMGDAHNFVAQAYKHAKPIGALGEGTELLTASEIGRLLRAIAGPATSAAPAGTEPVQNLSEVGRVRLASGEAAQKLAELGIVLGQNGGAGAAIQGFVTALGHHRYWGRPSVGQVPA